MRSGDGNQVSDQHDKKNEVLAMHFDEIHALLRVLLEIFSASLSSMAASLKDSDHGTACLFHRERSASASAYLDIIGNAEVSQFLRRILEVVRF